MTKNKFNRFNEFYGCEHKQKSERKVVFQGKGFVIARQTCLHCSARFYHKYKDTHMRRKIKLNAEDFAALGAIENGY